MLLTSFLSCRHSRTDRLFVQVCFGHSRVTSSRQACSSASFQPVDLLDWAPEDAAAAAAALFPGFGSAALNCWCMGAAGGWTFPKPGRGLRACTVSRQRDMRSSSSWTRLHAAIFNYNQLNRAPLTLPLKTPRWPDEPTTAKALLMNINDAMWRKHRTLYWLAGLLTFVNKPRTPVQ